jgi:cytidine deaminase
VDKKVFPCGQCLQVMSEFFDLETPINVYTFDGKFIPYTLKEFLPFIFKKRIIDDVNSKKAK